MLTRIATGASLILLAVTLIHFQGWPLRIVLGIMMLISVHEMYRALEHHGDRPVRWIGYVYCALACLAQSFCGVLDLPVFELISPPMFALVLGLLGAMIAVVLRGKVDFDSLTATIFPMLYPGLFFTLILPLQDMPGRLISILALVLTFFIASVSDMFALFAGVRFGRHKLSPAISPKKTVEGSVAGLLSAVLFSMLVPAIAMALRPYMPAAMQAEYLPPIWAFGVLGLIAGALAQFGDLTASMVKRHCGIKDFGNILPGHGGIMDRMDGILFCGAACYAFFRLLGI